MKPVQIAQVAEAVSGTIAWGDPAATVDQVVIDSREAGAGCLFVPIIGERVDAHRFIPDVLEQGAACTFSSDHTVRGEKGACIYVEDTLRALQDLAAWYRGQFDLPVIGITGSVGKTTTKEMIAAVMAKKYRTLKTLGNLNSQIGLSLMMFHLEKDTEAAVFEMGISMPGEMDRLVRIARPGTAVLTNIGVSHIGNLGSRENICREKGKIVSCLTESGALYVCGNGDLRQMSEACVPAGDYRRIYYGIEPDFEFYADEIQVMEQGQSFTFHYPGGTERVELSVMGTHNINNAVAALALAIRYEIPLSEAREALREYRPIAMRGQVKKVKGAYLIDDTYNASPDSINSNLHALFDYPGEGRKIAVY